MRYVLFIIFLCLPTLLFAQQFQFHQELDSIPVRDGEYQIPAPWTGGYRYSNIDLCDIDEDGLTELMLGSANGSVSLWENQGTVYQPDFHLANTSFQGLDSLNATFPKFWDMDADGDLDLFLYTWAGAGGMQVYENIGTPTAPNLILVTSTLTDANGDPIYGTDFDLVDIDGDGDKDLFIGTFDNGYVKYYENTGDSAHYSFRLITSTFENIQVGFWCCPRFCDIDADGDYDLFVGDYYGHIHFYRNDGTPQQYDFTLVSDNWMNISVGNNASPEFADLDGDGDYDLVIGKNNESSTPTPPGAVHYYQNVGTPQVPDMQLVTQSFLTFDAGFWCEPRLTDIDHDGDLDLFFMTNNWLGWMKNVGTPQNPSFEVQSYTTLSVPPGSYAFTELSGDSLPDLVTDDGWGGSIHYWRTTFQNEQLSFQTMGQMDTPYIINEVPFGDLDGDGQDEMLLGGFQNIPNNRVLAYYENQSTPGNPNFVFVTDNYQNLLDNLQIADIIPWLSDVDMDGDLDLLMLNAETNTVFLLTNIGTPQNAQFVLTNQNFLNEEMINEPFLGSGDIDDDGDMDFFTGHSMGGMKFFRNITDTSAVFQPTKMRPRPSQATLSIGPNPSNPITAISYQLSVVSLVNLSVYDISGRRVAQLVNGRQNPGDYSVSWNATGNASGVYLVRLTTPGEEVTQKVVVLK